MDLTVFSVGVNLSNSEIEEFNAVNNFYAIDRSDIVYNANHASFSYTTLINYINANLSSSVIYFTPFIELSGGTNDTRIAYNIYLLPSFASDSKYNATFNTGDQDNSDSQNYNYPAAIFAMMMVTVIGI